MRYLGIDFARTIAVVSVMVSHSLTASNLHGPLIEGARVLLTFATPTFFCLFGVMQQIVYEPKFEAGKAVDVTQRLWARAFQCWLLYVMTCAVLAIFGHLSFLYFVRCSLFMGETAFTDILRFYSLMLFLSPLLLLVSARIGLWPLVLVSLLIHAAFPLISKIGPVGTFPGADSVSSFLYGGTLFTHTGPSVIHGVGFVVAGMVIGKILKSRPGAELLLAGPGWTVRAVFALMVGACAIWLWQGHYDYTNGAVRTLLRNSNHPLYLLMGITIAVIYIDFFTLVRRAANIGDKSAWMAFGRTGLFIFAYGNALVYALERPHAYSPPSVVLFLTMIISILVMAYAYYRFRESDWLKSDHPASSIYRRIVDRSAIDFVKFVTDPIFRRHPPDSSLPTAPFSPKS